MIIVEMHRSANVILAEHTLESVLNLNAANKKQQAELIQCLWQELSLLASLHHPNVVAYEGMCFDTVEVLLHYISLLPEQLGAFHSL